MTDTGKPSTGLSAKHQAFVDEFLKDRRATDAAQRAGYSPRTAASLMALPMIKAEIKRRLSLIAVDSSVSLKSLIAEAEAARDAAETAGNASAMVAAIKLKADLTGHLDGSQQTSEPVTCTTAETAAAVLDMFKQLGWHVTVRQGALGTASVNFVDGPAAASPPPGAVIVDKHQPLENLVPDELVDEDRLEREQPMATSPEPEPTPRRRLIVGECETFESGVYLQCVEIPGSLEQKFEVRDGTDMLHCYKRDYQAAVDAANALVVHSKHSGAPSVATEASFSAARTKRSGEQ